MDQINALKGYGKVTHLEDQNPPASKPDSKILSSKSLRLTTVVVLTSLIICLIIGAYIDKSTAGKKPFNPADIIKIVCNVTRYPDSCFTSIFSLNSSPEPDPEFILKLSLQVSLNELSNMSRSLKTLAASSNGGAALKDCESQIEEAISQVKDSTAEMESGALTESKIGNIQTWMSSAMTDQESCLDGLEEIDSTSFGEVKTRMRKSMEYVSNTLAIVANIHVILDKFNMPLH